MLYEGEYIMENKILTINEIINMSETDKINAYRQGYVLQELYTSSNILKLGMSTCPDNIQQGTTKSIAASMVSLGTPNYVYKLYMKEATAVTFTELERYPAIGAVPNTTPDTSHIFSHIFDEAVGSYIIKTDVVDSCIDGALSDESICPINITLEVPILTSIVISPATALVGIGSIEQLTATCKDQNNNVMPCPTLSWLSSDVNIATVSSTGLVTGVIEGTVTITASYGTIPSNISTITVGAAPEPTSISITPISTSVNIGSTKQLIATCKDQYDNSIDCPTLTWSSIDDTIATVDSSGKVTGIKEGMTNVTASDGTITSNISTITVTTIPIKEAGMNPLLMLAIGVGFLYAILKKK